MKLPLRLSDLWLNSKTLRKSKNTPRSACELADNWNRMSNWHDTPDWRARHVSSLWGIDITSNPQFPSCLSGPRCLFFFNKVFISDYTLLFWNYSIPIRSMICLIMTRSSKGKSFCSVCYLDWKNSCILYGRWKCTRVIWSTHTKPDVPNAGASFTVFLHISNHIQSQHGVKNISWATLCFFHHVNPI